ncbi:MAG: branched-chain amino acid ABC transporter permease [Christensenellales bacterium]|jgi:branched-chain amino acid transport system permease protein
METILQLLISGVGYGCIYCLVAIEYSVIFKATGLINFSHEKWIMLGAYVFAATLIRTLGLGFIESFILTAVIMALFGSVIAITIFNPLRNMPSTLYVVVGTIMLANILSELARLIWGSSPFHLENFFSGTANIGSVVLPNVMVWIIVITGIFLFLQYLLFNKTKLGKAMRCVSSDKMAASLMGINVSQNIVFTVAYSAVICGIIGIMVIPIFNVDVNMAGMIALKGFAASVVGGFGTIPGAIVGALFIGLTENIYLLFGPGIYKDVVAFAMLILFLIIRPQGIIGKKKS